MTAYVLRCNLLMNSSVIESNDEIDPRGFLNFYLFSLGLLKACSNCFLKKIQYTIM